MDSKALNAVYTFRIGADFGLSGWSPRHVDHQAIHSSAGAYYAGGYGQGARRTGWAQFWTQYGGRACRQSRQSCRKELINYGVSGAPEVIRTPDLLVRSSKVACTSVFAKHCFVRLTSKPPFVLCRIVRGFPPW